jgi:[protein-PII] uridylyltransferase
MRERATAAGPLAPAAPASGAGIAAWRELLARGRADLQQRFPEELSPARLIHAHRALVDRVLAAVWRGLGMEGLGALVAAGGYGRGELFPHSDVDLLLLLRAPPDALATAAVERFIGCLWDIGLEVGHSVRTVDDCVALSAQDATVATALLETRWLAGDRALAATLTQTLDRVRDLPAYVKAKRLEQDQRHERYRDTNLEPNIKETAGGLRDLHLISWIARAAGMGQHWSDLVRLGIITRTEARNLKRDADFLMDLRVRLHYLTGRREERLVFDVQTALATQMGFRDTAHRRASEHLMQRFYRAAKEVRQLNEIVLQNLSTKIFPPRTTKPAKINERFQNRNELLDAVDEGVFRREPTAIFEAFRLLQERGELKGITAPTLRALWRASAAIGPAFRRDPRNQAQFLDILKSPAHFMREVRRLNDYGVLGRYIPAFGRIEGQMQHDLYHVYTVDEHILRVLRNVRRFAVPELGHEFPLCSRLMSGFERPEVLYLAALFHDIAKGRGGDHSTLGADDATRFCKQHHLSADDVALVAWLVEQHLQMSSVAQKQDLSDPDVIRAFAVRVGTERRLIALYLLTVADVRGTSPKVWNAWKAKLLEDLFWATRRALGGDTAPLASITQERQDGARARLRLYAVPDRAEEALWKQLDTTYFLRHDVDEIAWHSRQLYARVDTNKPIIKARLSPAGEGLQLMIYVQDQKDLFARICSFFERTGYSIAEAKIYTTRHGYALDSFQIHDPNNKQPQYRDLIGYFEFELSERLQQQAPLEAPLSGRVSRQLKAFPLTPAVDIQPDDRGLYKVLSITAGDRPGLLSRVARCLIQYGVNLHTAKINTLGARAEDVFLIQGAALDDAKKVVKLETDLLEALQV